MFKHLLVPIASEEMISKTFKHVSRLVKEHKARVTLVHISEPIPLYMYESHAYGFQAAEENHKKNCESYAKKLFDLAAVELGSTVKFDVSHLYNVNVFEGIVEAAKSAKVDVILMASHKRTGLKGLFMGSDTNAVIKHTKLPVLVI
jgi:nucleotide-binding universal stress UspA family protein